MILESLLLKEVFHSERSAPQGLRVWMASQRAVAQDSAHGSWGREGNVAFDGKGWGTEGFPEDSLPD